MQTNDKKILLLATTESSADDDFNQTTKYLHEHTWKRLMWWRDEMWRVTIPVWTAFAGLIAAVLAISSDKDKGISLYQALYIWIGLIGMGSIIMMVYWKYINTIYDAIQKLNVRMEYYENTLKNKRYEIHANYKLYKTAPDLTELFIAIGIILIVVACGITANAIKGANINTFEDIATLLKNMPQVHCWFIPSFSAFIILLFIITYSYFKWQINKLQEDAAKDTQTGDKSCTTV